MESDLLNAALVAVASFLILRMVLAWRGRVPSAKAHELVEGGAQLLDVRTPGEVASGALPGAKNIPVGELSGRLGELDRGRALVVYCASGMRSSKAVGILKQAGFDAHDLGPMRAW